jgi:hypothetical protein
MKKEKTPGRGTREEKRKDKKSKQKTKAQNTQWGEPLKPLLRATSKFYVV